MDGKRLFTPMVMVFITIGMTDLLFAVDSIPAIFGLTQSAFIVFTANIFALMGLRQLYFLLGGLMDRLVYLKHGLSVHPGLHRREARSSTRCTTTSCRSSTAASTSSGSRRSAPACRWR